MVLKKIGVPGQIGWKCVSLLLANPDAAVNCDARTKMMSGAALSPDDGLA